MAIDPSRFQTTSVVDTCAVWNILSSNCLYTAATVANCHFVITSFVEYECLRKPRTRVRTSDHELVSQLRRKHSKGLFLYIDVIWMISNLRWGTRNGWEKEKSRRLPLLSSLSAPCRPTIKTHGNLFAGRPFFCPNYSTSLFLAHLYIRTQR